MNAAGVLTQEKADALFQRIAKGIEENKFSLSADTILYAMKEAWIAGFEDGRKYPGQNRTPLMFLRLEEIAADLRRIPLVR
jgi:hypothetical protein